MILRRLTTALRKQDWVTVLVETLIVVFGVFIGLQVNNWNTARVDHQQEARYLERVAQDFVTIQDRIQRGQEAANQGMRGCLITLRAINIANEEQPGELPGDAELFEAFQACGGSIRPPGTSATLQEMIASGAFADLRNPRLRTLLYEFDQSVEMFDRSYSGNFESAQLIDLGLISDIQRFKSDPDAKDHDARFKVISIDRERVLNNGQLRGAFMAYRDFTEINLIWLFYQQERVDEIVDILKSETAP